MVALTNPTILSTIILVAGSMEAYLTATRQPSLLNQILDGRILRDGDRVQLITGNSEVSLSFVYHLQQLEPVSQGLARPGQTKIILLSSGAIPATLAEKHEYLENDAIEIDESFLAGSVLNTQFDRPEARGFPTMFQGCNFGKSNTSLPHFDIDYFDSLQEFPEENWVLYVRTTDLGRIGLLSRNWVSLPRRQRSYVCSYVIKAIACSTLSQSRLVRVVANDVVALPSVLLRFSNDSRFHVSQSYCERFSYPGA